METIFDHQVNEFEIEVCGFFDDWQRIRHGINFAIPIDKLEYLTNITTEAAIFDIALLLEERGQDAKAYWEKIPIKEQEYRLGFDNELIPID